jgi:hypothetical protein
VAGPGFTISVLPGWTVRKTAKTVVAASGPELVSVTRFPLVKRYEPAKFAAVSQELDRIADQLAARGGGAVTKRQTVTVDGGKIRAYRFTAKGTAANRIGFVLVGKTEYQLICSGRIGAGCELLFSSFSSA